MVAVALSEEYGVKVVSNGSRAFTSFSPDGKKPVITIPSVACDDTHYVDLLRGYVDHEVGHVRFTNHGEMDAALTRRLDIAGALKTIIHIYEDIRVERLMGQCFPGCRRNLRTLVSLVFRERRPLPVDAREVWDKASSPAAGGRDVSRPVWTALAQYILYRTRQDAHQDLAALLPAYRRPLDGLAPGLAERLEPVLSKVGADGTHTRANIALAEETLRLVENFFGHDWTWPGEDKAFNRDQALSQLGWMLKNGGSAGESVDLGQAAAQLVENILSGVDSLSVTRDIIVQHGYGSPPWRDRLSTLSEREQKEALQASAMLDAQLQSLVQTLVLNRSGSARRGKLDTRVLHRLSVGNSRIFRRTSETRGLNTEIVLAVDMSGSMRGRYKSVMASKALYAVILSLRKIPGLRSAVMGFYDNCALDILRPHDRVTPRMNLRPEGGTLCGHALRYAMQQFTGRRDSRKMVLMLTDGDSDNGSDFQDSIARAGASGIELLGIGILDDHILKYLPPDDCCVIDELRHLAPRMFRILRARLCGAP